MTTAAAPFSLLGMLSNTVLSTAPSPHPSHQALLEAHTHLQALDADLSLLMSQGVPLRAQDGVGEAETAVLLFVDLLATRRQLNKLLAADTCCTPATYDRDADQGGGDDRATPTPDPGNVPTAPCIIAACLQVFDTHGSPDALSSADLVTALRYLPGAAEGRWAYADLTPARLATLLRPYEVASRDITLADGRRRKSYRRSALLNAIPADCAC